MDEYIGREVAKKELLGWALLVQNPGYMKRDDAMYLLDHIPAADVAPVRHGKWAHSRYENCSEQFEIVKCSCCGHEAYAMAFYVRGGNYCPNCGARMDGGADNETD